MATSEARKRWPSKNRCYLHSGFAKEASKFSLSPSSNLLTSSESDRRPDSPKKEPHNTISDYMSPLLNSDISANNQWWLKSEPNFSRHPDFMIARNGSSDDDDFVLLGKEFVETRTYRDPCSVGSVKDTRDIWFLDDHLMDLDSLNSLVLEESNKLSSEFESLWVGSDKTEPWWRISGKDDLASLVAQKSLLEIENCDLPRPRVYRKQPSSCSRSLDRDDVLGSSLDQTVKTDLSCPNSNCPSNNSEQNFSKSGTEKPDSQSDQSKDELLRALCLSQKRAREAEEAAKQANSEKERVITLIFRQASHLFTYKQLIQLLQLEKICLQFKNKKNQPIIDLFPFPSVFPWTPRQPRKGRHKPRKAHGDSWNDIGKRSFAFLLGLGLAGAGLLLGWTMGWLFPNT